jgi:hypothetical protein
MCASWEWVGGPAPWASRMSRETERRRCLADKPPFVIELIAHPDVERANIVSGLKIAVSRQDQSENGLAWLVSPRHRDFPLSGQSQPGAQVCRLGV